MHKGCFGYNLEKLDQITELLFIFLNVTIHGTVVIYDNVLI